MSVNDEERAQVKSRSSLLAEGENEEIKHERRLELQREKYLLFKEGKLNLTSQKKEPYYTYDLPFGATFQISRKLYLCGSLAFTLLRHQKFITIDYRSKSV